MDEVRHLAKELREKHRRAEERVTFTHVPVEAQPERVLELMRASSLAKLLASAGQPLTHPERPWYGPIVVIRAIDADLQAAGVTASTWDEPPWEREDAELVVWLAYARDGARAQQRLSIYSGAAGLTLSRVFFDEQRAETGYEGDDRLTITPTPEQAIDLVHIIRDMTGA